MATSDSNFAVSLVGIPIGFNWYGSISYYDLIGDRTGSKADIEFYQSKLNEPLAEIIAHADAQPGAKSVLQVNTQMFFLDELI